MAKKVSSKSGTPDKVPKVKKTGNSIVRGHPTENIIHSARKRHPTQRLIESLAMTKKTVRGKKPKAIPVKKTTKTAGGKKNTTRTSKTKTNKKK